MKRLLLKSTLLLCALVIGSMNVWAEDVVYKEQQFKLGNDGTFSDGVSSYTASFDNTYNGFTCNYSNFNNNSKGWNYVKCGNKKGDSTGTITTADAIDKAISKVDLTIDAITTGNVTSIKLYTSSNKSSWTEAGTFTKATGAQSVIISSPAANLYYKIEAVCTQGTSNGLVTISNIKFYIEQVDITAISILTTETVGVGGTVTLTPTLTPVNATGTIDWESDNTSVATVDNGVVTGVAAGTAKITAKSHDDASIKAECTVTVTAPVAVTGVTLDKTTLPMNVGDPAATLTASITPADATNKGVTWETDDPDVATVVDGVVTAVGVGTCTITVKTDDGNFTATCNVTVNPKNTDVDLTSPIVISEWPSLSYGAAAEYEVDGISFTATQCMKNSGLQFRKSEGTLASPLIKSATGYTVYVTTNSSGTGTLTLKIGDGTPVSISSGTSTTYSATTALTSVSFTLTNSSSYACNIESITIYPNPSEPSDPVDNGSTITLSTTEAMDGWRAFYDGTQAYEVDENTTVYTVTAVESTAVTLKAEAGKVIPAATPVIVKTSAANREMTLTETTTAETLSGNILLASDGTHNVDGYRLGYGAEDGIAFYKYTATAPAAGIVYIPAASLTAPALTIEIGETTGVSEVRSQKDDVSGEYFNLNGQRVIQPTKGLYIVNGRKVLVP